MSTLSKSHQQHSATVHNLLKPNLMLYKGFRYIQMDIGVDNLRNAKKKVKRGEKEKAEIVKIGNDLHLNNSQVCKIAGIGMPGNYVFESKTSFGT